MYKWEGGKENGTAVIEEAGSCYIQGEFIQGRNA
jgi:hypothetical protein